MTQDATAAGLEAAFHAWARGLNEGDLDAFWSAIDDGAEILDEDYPWRMTKEEFVDHIDFHAGGDGLWEHFKWIPRELNFRVWGTTGHVSGFSTFRGKPRDAGFRQRFMGFTQTWYHKRRQVASGLLASESVARPHPRCFPELSGAERYGGHVRPTLTGAGVLDCGILRMTILPGNRVGCVASNPLRRGRRACSSQPHTRVHVLGYPQELASARHVDGGAYRSRECLPVGLVRRFRDLPS